MQDSSDKDSTVKQMLDLKMTTFEPTDFKNEG